MKTVVEQEKLDKIKKIALDIIHHNTDEDNVMAKTENVSFMTCLFESGKASNKGLEIIVIERNVFNEIVDELKLDKERVGSLVVYYGIHEVALLAMAGFLEHMGYMIHLGHSSLCKTYSKVWDVGYNLVLNCFDYSKLCWEDLKVINLALNAQSSSFKKAIPWDVTSFHLEYMFKNTVYWNIVENSMWGLIAMLACTGQIKRKEEDQ